MFEVLNIDFWYYHIKTQLFCRATHLKTLDLIIRGQQGDKNNEQAHHNSTSSQEPLLSSKCGSWYFRPVVLLLSTERFTICC